MRSAIFFLLLLFSYQWAGGQTIQSWPFENADELPTNEDGRRDLWVEAADAITLDSATVWSGSSSLRIDCQSGDCGVRYRFPQMDSLREGAIRLTGMVKTQNSWDSGPAYYSVMLVDAQGRRITNHGTWGEGPRSDTEWTDMSLEFPVPDNTSFLRLWIFTNGVGTTWFDDVRMEAIPWSTSDAVLGWISDRLDVWTGSWYAWLLALLAYAAIPAAIVSQAFGRHSEPEQLNVGWPLRWFGLVMATICGPFVFWSFEDIIPDVLANTGSYWDYSVFSLLFGSVACWIWYRNRTRIASAQVWRNTLLVIRFMLMATFISYSCAKFFRTQFAPLSYAQLDARLGDFTSMGLLWAFFGHSFPYVLFAGVSQMVGAFLMAFRRTYVLGAMILFVVVSNIVFVNFAYHIPVKFPSSVFLLMIVVILLEEAPRLWSLLVQRKASVPSAVHHPRLLPRPWGSVAGVVVFVLLLFHSNRLYTGYLEDWNPARDTNPIAGVWDVSERMPEPTDDSLVNDWDRLIINYDVASVGQDRQRRRLPYFERNDSTSTIAMLITGSPDTLRARYQLDADTLVLDGVEFGDSTRVRLTRRAFILER